MLCTKQRFLTKPYICIMGKRTVRIPRSKLRTQKETLFGKVIQVVSLEGKTHSGHLISMDDVALVLEDENAAWTSTKRHRRQVLLADIQYIAYDIVTTW